MHSPDWLRGAQCSSITRRAIALIIACTITVFATMGRDPVVEVPLTTELDVPRPSTRLPVVVRRWLPVASPELFYAPTSKVRLDSPTSESLVLVPVGGRSVPTAVNNNLYHYSNRVRRPNETAAPCDALLSPDADPMYRYTTGPLDVLERAASLNAALLRYTNHTRHWRAWPETAYTAFSTNNPSGWTVRPKGFDICGAQEGWSTMPVVDGVSFSKFTTNSTVSIVEQMQLLVDALLPEIKAAPNQSADVSTIGGVATYMCLTALSSPTTSLGPAGRVAQGGGIFIDPSLGLSWGPPHEGMHAVARTGGLRVPACLVTSGRNEAVVVGNDLFGYNLKWNITHSSPPSSIAPLAYFGYIERPQHAMQFLFSLLGHLAPLYDLCAQLVLQGARDVHVYFSVISYGKFRKHSDTTDFANFPHMELMALAPFLVERMRNVGHPYVSEPREQWRRALYSQIRFVHDGHTFGAATTVPPTIAAQEAAVRWGQRHLRSGKASPAPLLRIRSVAPSAEREGYLYNAVLIGGPGARLLTLKKYRQNDARRTAGSPAAIPFPGPFYLFMMRQLLIDYYGISTRQAAAGDFHAPDGSRLRQYRLLVVSRKSSGRRLILNEYAAVKAIILGLVSDRVAADRIASEVGLAHVEFEGSNGKSFVAAPGIWQLYTSPHLVLTVVDWEQVQFPNGKPKRSSSEQVDISLAALPEVVPAMLDVSLNTDVMLGMHGNGLCWACFMSSYTSQALNPFGRGEPFPHPSSMPTSNTKHKYPLMVEVTSDVAFRNEVAQGVNVKNVGNLAGTVCPITALSIAGTAVDNKYSRSTAEGHRWKEVDVSLNRHALRKITSFVAEYRPD
jgi:hypothetical protein